MLIAWSLASNVAPVVSDPVHQVAFNLFERIASLGWPDGLNALLSRSPTRMRQAKVERVLAPDPVQAPATAPAAKLTSSTTP